MNNNLNPCPFCGSPAEYTSIDKEFVRCSKGLKCPSEAQVYTVEDWNNRPLEDALRKALTEVVELCEKGGFISTDAKFRIIAYTARKALENQNKE